MRKHLFTGLMAAAALAAPAGAQAGTLQFHSCQTAAGAPNGNPGWTSSQVGQASTASTCSLNGGALSGQLTGNGPWTGGTVAEQAYTAPADLTIDRVQATRTVAGLSTDPTGYADRNGYVLETDLAELERREPGRTGEGNITGAYDSGDGLAAHELHAYVGCNLTANRTCTRPAGDTPRFSLRQVVLTLADTYTPTVTAVGGPLTGAGAKKGPLSIAFDPADRGSGVYRAMIDVDGDRLVSQVVDANGGQCADARPGDDDPYQFDAAVPCRLNPAATRLTLDTARLDDGEHDLRVLLEDAAGNATTVYAATITVDNVPSCRDSEDNDADGRVDAEDPACHSDGNPANAASYTPERDSESPDPACANGRDDDGDGVSDELDPGCHSDGDPSNDSSYVPGKTSETDPPKRPTSIDTIDPIIPDPTSSDPLTPTADPLAPASTPATEPAAKTMTQAPVNGAGASRNARLTAWFVRGGHKARTSTYGSRVVIRGRLVDENGKAIRGARITLTHTIPGGRKIGKTGATTQQDGRFRVTLPMDLSTRSLTFSYFYVVRTDSRGNVRGVGKPTSAQTLKLTVVPRKKGTRGHIG
jgi:hypothetical protein